VGFSVSCCFGIQEKQMFRPFALDSKLTIRDLALPYAVATPYKLLFAHIWQHKPTYIVGSVALIIGVMIESAVPKLIQWMLDVLQSASASEVSAQKLPFLFHGRDPKALFQSLLGFLLLLIALQWFSRRNWRLTLGLETHQIGGDFKSMIWERVRFFRSDRLATVLTKGVLMNAATGDAGSARMLFGWVYAGLFDTAFLITFAVIGMMSINVSIALTVSSCLLLVPFIGYALGKLALRRYGEAQESLSELNELIAQSVATVRLQRLSQTEGAWSDKVLTAAETFRKRRLKESYTFQHFILLFGIPPVFALLFLFWCGFEQLQAGELSVGEFVAFQSYVVMMISPLSDIGFLLADWQKGRGSLERVCNLLKEPLAEEVLMPEKALTALPELPITTSEIGSKGVAAVFEVSHLSFSYPSHEDESGEEMPVVLDKVSLRLGQGERLGIYGSVGCGKSTLLSILAGLRRGYTGQVNFYGKDIRSYSPALLRESIAIVDQKPFLFADTVRNNVALSREHLTDDEVLRVLRIAGLAEDVLALPNGLHTQLGEWGINLSGGQRQRLTLARALAAKPKVLILDDCLSAVDTVTEEAIIESLNTEMNDVTIVWVAHRRSTLRYCNQLMRLPS
jgi:ATP-binding cassette, subfamily B, multidrug efflux pump